jgi:hypothetical protein
MRKVPNVPWWSSIALGPQAPAPETDYADMGTAFGLDASLALPDDEAGGDGERPVADRGQRGRD